MKRENKSQAKAQECFYLGHEPNYPRNSVRMSADQTPYCAYHASYHWQRVSPAPPVPAQMHDSLCTEEGGSEADDESTPDRGGGRAVNELDDGLAHLNDVDVTWGFDLDAFLQELAQQVPAAGKAGDGTAETMDSSQGGAVDASSAPAGRAETAEAMGSSQGGAANASSAPAGRAETTETMDSSQGGVVDASSTPAERAETVETMGSSQGGAVDASSVPAGRAESDSGALAASDGEDPHAVQSGRAAHELSSWGLLPATVKGRTRGQSQRLEGEPAQCRLRMQPEVADALLAAVYAWMKYGSTLKYILDDGGRNGHEWLEDLL